MFEHKIMATLALAESLPAKAFCKMLRSVWLRGAEMKKPWYAKWWRTSCSVSFCQTSRVFLPRVGQQGGTHVTSEHESFLVLQEDIDGRNASLVFL